MDEIALNNWAAYRFGRYETRLVGYTNAGRCIVTDPIGVASPEFVETTNGIRYRPGDPIKAADKIDIMYTLDRFCNVNDKIPPQDITESFIKELEGKE